MRLKPGDNRTQAQVLAEAKKKGFAPGRRGPQPPTQRPRHPMDERPPEPIPRRKPQPTKATPAKTSGNINTGPRTTGDEKGGNRPPNPRTPPKGFKPDPRTTNPFQGGPKDKSSTPAERKQMAEIEKKYKNAELERIARVNASARGLAQRKK
jgi:hypothetical protein